MPLAFTSSWQIDMDIAEVGERYRVRFQEWPVSLVVEVVERKGKKVLCLDYDTLPDRLYVRAAQHVCSLTRAFGRQRLEQWSKNAHPDDRADLMPGHLLNWTIANFIVDPEILHTGRIGGWLEGPLDGFCVPQLQDTHWNTDFLGEMQSIYFIS